jgi:hypothetical protein
MLGFLSREGQLAGERDRLSKEVTGPGFTRIYSALPILTRSRQCLLLFLLCERLRWPDNATQAGS